MIKTLTYCFGSKGACKENTPST